MAIYDPHALKIYIDGSAYNNPGGVGGIAGWVEYPDSWMTEDQEIFNEGFDKTNISRAELMACIKAMRWVREHLAGVDIGRVLIFTDSEYVSNNQNRAEAWRKAGYRNASGRPIENPDLWKEYLSVKYKTGVRTEIHWNKGKTSPILKSVDKSAKSAAKQSLKKKDWGFRESAVATSKVKGGSSEMYPASGQEDNIYVYRKQLAGRSRNKEYKLFFNLFNPGSSTYFGKYVAYITDSVERELHRQHYYRVLFNDDLKYPKIVSLVCELEKPNPEPKK
ncbi:MAG: RNase H family protein [Patescibacteria group bacterium]|jgi:ribonuclease HI